MVNSQYRAIFLQAPSQCSWVVTGLSLSPSGSMRYRVSTCPQTGHVARTQTKVRGLVVIYDSSNSLFVGACQPPGLDAIGRNLAVADHLLVEALRPAEPEAVVFEGDQAAVFRGRRAELDEKVEVEPAERAWVM